MGLKLTNRATTTLASSINASVTSISVAIGTGSLFPSLSPGDWFPVLVVDATDYEIMRATARTSDVLTVTRGQEGSTAKSFLAGSVVDLRVTAAALAEYAKLNDSSSPTFDDLTVSDDLTVGGDAAIAGNVAVTGTINLGNADTTLARAGAGDVSVEGNIIYRAGGTNVAVADGGSGANDAAGARAAFGLELATAAEILAGTAKVVTGDALLGALAGVPLTDAATIAVDLATFVSGTVTIGGNRTLGNPTNHKVGRTIYVTVKQDGTGSRTLAYDTQYDFGQDSAPTLSTGAGKEDLLAFFVKSSTKMVFLGIRKDIG